MSILLERYDQLDLPLYRRVAFGRETVAVAPKLPSEVSEARAALLDYLASGARAYGVNTGLGYLAGRVVEDVDQAAFQRSILAGRSTGLGRPLCGAGPPAVRAGRARGDPPAADRLSQRICRRHPGVVLVPRRSPERWVVPGRARWRERRGGRGRSVGPSVFYVGRRRVRVGGWSSGFRRDPPRHARRRALRARRQGGHRADQRRAARTRARRATAAAGRLAARARDAVRGGGDRPDRGGGAPLRPARRRA